MTLRFRLAKARLACAVCALATFASGPASAQVLLETYTARLSRADHFNSNGERLMTPAAILRQDRANFHRFGVRDREDTGDSFFANPRNRELMERYIANGRITQSAGEAVVNGTPFIRVEIYRDNGRDFINVSVSQ